MKQLQKMAIHATRGLDYFHSNTDKIKKLIQRSHSPPKRRISKSWLTRETAYPAHETTPVGSLRRSTPQSQYKEYLRRCGHPGLISVTSDDIEPSEDSSPSSPDRSRTCSHSPHVTAPTLSPILFPLGCRPLHLLLQWLQYQHL